MNLIVRKEPFWDVGSGRAAPPPAAELLGWELVSADPEAGTIEVAFTATEQFLNSMGTIQGGFLAAMLDATLGPALVATLGPGQFAPTTDLHVQFLRPARPGRLTGHGRIVRRGSQVAFLAGELMDESGQPVAAATATAQIRTGAAPTVRIRGSRLVLRALGPAEIDEQWRAMVTADPMTIAQLPDEASFKARLQRSGRLNDGWLDLAIDLDGAAIGRIQTFVPAERQLAPGTFDVGIGLDENMRGKGYGREALMLLTGWLFEHAGAQVVEAPTDPANAAMRTVFGHAGWSLAGPLTEHGREWVLYRITRQEWQAQVCRR